MSYATHQLAGPTSKPKTSSECSRTPSKALIRIACRSLPWLAGEAARLCPRINQGVMSQTSVEEPLWIEQLRRLADADDRNPLLSGYACAILLERGLIASEDLAPEVSRRLSPGVPADLGAGWFEGLAQRNRYALLARQTLWEQLAEYTASLDDDQFGRALVFLRRAFSTFSPREQRRISENLASRYGQRTD